MGQGPLAPSYESGHDFAVEVDGVRFRFNADDFASRIGAAAVRLGLLTRARLGPTEVRDLVAFAADGVIAEPASGLAAHLDVHAVELAAAGEDPVQWLRRLVFRGAWIDAQVSDGTLAPVFEEGVGFRYRSAATGEPAAEEPAVPDWSSIAYGGGP